MIETFESAARALWAIAISLREVRDAIFGVTEELQRQRRARKS